MNRRYLNLLILCKALSFPGSRVWASTWIEEEEGNEILYMYGGLGYGSQEGQGKGW